MKSIVKWLIVGLLLSAFSFCLIDNYTKINLFAQIRKTDDTGDPSSKDKPLPATLQRKTFVDISKLVTPSVVNINVTSKRESRDENDSDEPDSTGSGVIMDKKGHILTNAHVVKRSEILTVVLHDKREFSAKIVGMDENGDLAVIVLEEPPENLKPALFGNSEEVEVGDWVVAVGNPLGIGMSVTAGIVSAWRGKEDGEDVVSSTDTYIQTDAAVNPGNSGGPLINLQGEVIGINSMIVSRTGNFAGIGLAIPIQRAKIIAEALIKDKKFYRPYIGLNGAEITLRLARYYNYKDLKAFMTDLKITDTKGVFVARIYDNSPSSKCGIQEGDIIIEFAGKKIEKAGDFKVALGKSKLDTEVEAKINHRGTVKTIKITIGKE
jgi:serine protease Do